MKRLQFIVLLIVSLLFVPSTFTTAAPDELPCNDIRLNVKAAPLTYSSAGSASFSSFIPTASKAASAQSGYVKARELNLRSEPDTDSLILGQFHKYDTLTVLGKKGEWYRVRIDGLEGYMLREYVSVGTPPKHTDNDSGQAVRQSSQRTSYTVYITETGSKYHRGGCRYLAKSKIAVEYSDALARGYTACSVCKP